MNILELFKPIRTFVFDLDGVITDAKLMVAASGEQMRYLNSKDLYALQLAVQMGYRVMICSNYSAQGVKLRLQKIGIADVFTEVAHKSVELQTRIESLRLDPARLLYMGDDIPDISAMKLAGLPCCPADAAPEVLEVSKYVSPYIGGAGCVRDVLEKTMKLNGHWESVSAK